MLIQLIEYIYSILVVIYNIVKVANSIDFIFIPVIMIIVIATKYLFGQNCLYIEKNTYFIVTG